MKKVLILAALFVGALFVSNTSSAQEIYVRVRPTPPVYVRPAPPRPDHIWVEPEWVWRGGRYEFVPGYWTAPRRGFRYVPGYWRHTRRGEFWVAGYWRR